MWRGTTGVGISQEKNLPFKWSATENIAWKVTLPYRGNSTPIIWGEKIFLTQPLEEEKERANDCYDQSDGEVPVVAEPHARDAPDDARAIGVAI